MQDFITENKLKFIRVLVKINKETNKKQFQLILKDWKLKTFEELVEIENNRNKSEAGHYFIELGKNFMVLDTDTEEDFDKLILILKDLNIYQPLAITLSTRGDLYDYKRHFWFRITEPLNIDGPQKFNKLDVLYGHKGQVCEKKKSTLSDIPILTVENYKFIKSVFKPQKEENPIAPSDIANNNFSLREILEHLNPSRFINYSDWLNLYFIFVNEGFDIELFKEFSKKHYPAYNEEDNNKILSSVSATKGYTKSTLYFWLKIDDNKYYQTLYKKEETHSALFNYQDHDKICLEFFQMFGNKYFYSKTTNSWYIINEQNIYECYKEPFGLINDFSLFVRTTYENLLKFYTSDLEKTKFIEGVMRKMLQATYFKSIFNYTLTHFNHPNIENLLGSNCDLFAFENCLFDLKKKEFRPIQVNDFIGKHSNIKLSHERNETEKTKFYNLVGSMFSTTEMRDYHLQTVSEAMFGNRREAFYINTGKGRNGKGVCSAIFAKVFGSYYYQAPNNFLVSDYQAGAPNSALIHMKECRMVVSSEPYTKGETNLNEGMIKTLTGGDTINARDLHEKAQTFKNTATIFLQCNSMPTIENFETALKERLKNIKFDYIFTDNPTKPNEKLINNELKETINTNAFINEVAHILIDINLKPKIPIPQQVKDDVCQYMEDNNPVGEFLKFNYEITTNAKDRIPFAEIYQRYNDSDGPFLSKVKFSKALKQNDLEFKMVGGYKNYIFLKLLAEENELD